MEDWLNCQISSLVKYGQKHNSIITDSLLKLQLFSNPKSSLQYISYGLIYYLDHILLLILVIVVCF